MWGEIMVPSVIMLGATMTLIALIINLSLLKVNKKSYANYYASIFFSIVGLLLLAIASVVPKVDLLGSGFGGWGIAAMFASAISFMITGIVDAFANAEVTEKA